jgi:glycosyltransferase involved in cell wall biosynthesis
MAIPQVSVIIPTRNRSESLPLAIRSVVGQTFTDFELVIVDDASDEPVHDIVKGFKDARVRCIRHERRRGGAAARNTGIRNTTGEFVAFLDDDDEWYPEKLARQVSILLRSDSEIGAVYAGYDVVNRNTGSIPGQKVPVHRGDLSSVLLTANLIGTTSCMLLRRKCFADVGMFDESLPSFQDYDLWIRLSRAYQFDYASECLLKYHLHSNKIWTNPNAILEGLDILVDRYGGSEKFRKRCSVYYLSVAVQFCEAGEGRKARRALRRAILLDPFDSRHYLYSLLSLLNLRTYQKVQRSKTKILGRLHHIHERVPQEIGYAQSKRHHSDT